MRLRLLLALFASLLLAFAACGASQGTVPTDSKVKPFKPPATEDLSAEEQDSWDIDAEDEGDDTTGGDEATEGGDEGGVEGGVEGGEESD